jgi:hypothetical protein
MKSLLIRLTHGLFVQDVADSEKELIQQWMQMKLLNFDNNKNQ